jgi:hypothetical protein
VDPPAAAGGDAGDLLDVDVDQLAGPFALIATHRFDVGGAIAVIEPAEPFTVEDRLHRGGGEVEFVSDVGGTPSMSLPEGDDAVLDRWAGLVR